MNLFTLKTGKYAPFCRVLYSFLVMLMVGLLFIGIDKQHNEWSLGKTAHAHDFGGRGSGEGDADTKDGEDPNKCEPGPGMCCLGAGSGNKVVYYNGAETFSRTDLVVNGVFPIKLTRKYNSRSEYDSPLGYGWSHNHDFRIYEYKDNSVVLRNGCGIKTRYIETTPNTYQRQPGSLLANISKLNGELTVSYLNGEVQFFDVQGRMLWWQDVEGNRLEYTYDANDKLPLTGASPYAIDPSQPMVVAYNYQLTRVEERLAGGALSGNYIDFVYNPTTGRLISATSNDGRAINYAHDVTVDALTLGNLTSVNGLEGLVSTYQYNDVDATSKIQDYHNITSIQEGASTTPVIEQYDEQDRVIKETHGNQVLDFEYVVPQLHTRITEAIKDEANITLRTRVQNYHFDPVSNLVTRGIDGEGNETVYQRNGLSLIETETLHEGNFDNGPVPVVEKIINRTYYTNGRIAIEAITLDSGEMITSTRTYEGTLEKMKEVFSSLVPTKKFKTENVYNLDTNGNPTTIQASRRYKDNGIDYLETSYTYNANGDVLTTTLPDGHVTENEYGAAYGGQYMTKTTHKVVGAPVPDLQETYEYDTKGNRTKVTDARGYFTTTTYDDKNRRKTETNHLGHLTTYVYDANDNLTNIIRDRSAVGDQVDNTKLTYDGKNQLTQIDRTGATPAFIKRASLRYDSAGNVIAVSDALGNETTLDYDLENRLTMITDNESNYIEYTLNTLGHRIATKYYKSGGVLVHESSAVFDDLDRQEQLIGAISQTTTFTYDAVGNRITAIDALSRPATVYTYDTLSRLTNIKDANGKDTVYAYDDRDQLRYVTDPRGLQTEYQYNELGQLKTLISPDTGITDYTYDLAGNRKTQKDARNITVTFGYDALNRIISKSYPTTTLNVTYGYDAGTNGLGKLTSMIDGEGNTTYEYDERGNLTKTTRTTNTQPYVTEYGYDLNDRQVKLTYPSGRVVDYVRNTLGQVTSVITTPSGGSAQTIASSITYLPFGALEDMSWGNGLALDQTFDSDYRLTDQVLGTNYSRAYGYDVVNNIKSVTDNITAAKNQNFNYDGLDRLDDADGGYGLLDYAYDDVGNRISLTLDGGAPTAYNYSVTANQLDDIGGLSITYDAVGNTKTKDGLSFTYDDTNRMVQTNTTNYGFNGRGERVRKAGAVTTLYHYDNSGNLLFESDTSANTQVEYIWLGSQRLAMVDSTGLYFAHGDHLGTVQLLTDGSSGSVVWSVDFDPFGAGTVDAASTVTYNLRFPGQYYDEETNLHYNYFRDYDPSLGRYVQSDPLGLDWGLNTYGYAYQNPLFWIDPFGLVNQSASSRGRRPGQTGQGSGISFTDATTWTRISSGPETAIVAFGDGVFGAITLGIGDLDELRQIAGVDRGFDKCSALYSGFSSAGNLLGAGALGGAAGTILLGQADSASNNIKAFALLLRLSAKFIDGTQPGLPNDPAHAPTRLTGGNPPATMPK